MKNSCYQTDLWTVRLAIHVIGCLRSIARAWLVRVSVFSVYADAEKQLPQNVGCTSACAPSFPYTANQIRTGWWSIYTVRAVPSFLETQCEIRYKDPSTHKYI